MKISTLHDSTESDRISSHVRALQSIRKKKLSRLTRLARATRRCQFSVGLSARAIANGNYAFSG